MDDVPTKAVCKELSFTGMTAGSEIHSFDWVDPQGSIRSPSLSRLFGFQFEAEGTFEKGPDFRDPRWAPTH